MSLHRCNSEVTEIGLIEGPGVPIRTVEEWPLASITVLVRMLRQPLKSPPSRTRINCQVLVLGEDTEAIANIVTKWVIVMLHASSNIPSYEMCT